jgi:hypothetical protein
LPFEGKDIFVTVYISDNTLKIVNGSMNRVKLFYSKDNKEYKEIKIVEDTVEDIELEKFDIDCIESRDINIDAQKDNALYFKFQALDDTDNVIEENGHKLEVSRKLYCVK